MQLGQDQISITHFWELLCALAPAGYRMKMKEHWLLPAQCSLCVHLAPDSRSKHRLMFSPSGPEVSQAVA